MLSISVDVESAGRLLRRALGLDERDAIRIVPAPGPNRNLVFKVDGPAHLYLKVYPSDSTNREAAAEARSIQLLVGALPVPRVVRHGFDSLCDVDYLITSGVQGERLDTLITAASCGDCRPLLSELAWLVARLADNTKAIDALRSASREFVGAFAVDFSPRNWVIRRDGELRSIVEVVPEAGIGPLLGSLSTNNVIAVNTNGRLKLSAILDLEGARLGPLGFDQAMLWYDLLLQDREDLADVWVAEVARHSCRGTMGGMIASVAWLSLQRSSHTHAERGADLKLRPLIRRKLVAMKRMMRVSAEY